MGLPILLRSKDNRTKDQSNYEHKDPIYAWQKLCLRTPWMMEVMVGQQSKPLSKQAVPWSDDSLISTTVIPLSSCIIKRHKLHDSLSDNINCANILGLGNCTVTPDMCKELTDIETLLWSRGPTGNISKLKNLKQSQAWSYTMMNWSYFYSVGLSS